MLLTRDQIPPDLMEFFGPAECGECYVCHMVAVFREVRRVLRRDGTCWLNIGDSYASQGGPQVEQTKQHIGSGYHGTNRNLPGLKPKDLVGIPWRLAFALQADGWYLRSDVIWSKPNPMPESVTDRPTKAHEYLFLLTRSPRYFYDADAIREPSEAIGPSWDERKANGEVMRHGLAGASANGSGGYGASPAGRNKRSVWEIATEPYPDAHFATFPQALVEPCVLAGTSERGCCPECGAPWEREVERKFYGSKAGDGDRMTEGFQRNRMGGQKFYDTEYVAPKTIGWRPTCDHHGAVTEPGTEPIRSASGGQARAVGPGSVTVPCTVLDPFMGSGTTALVARRHGRRSIGIELNETYAALAAKRTRQLSLLAGTAE